MHVNYTILSFMFNSLFCQANIYWIITTIHHLPVKPRQNRIAHPFVGVVRRAELSIEETLSRRLVLGGRPVRRRKPF